MSTTVPTKELPAKLQQILKRSGYRRHTARLYIVPSDHAESIRSSAWDGGSRTITAFYDPGTLQLVSVPSEYRPGGFTGGFRPSSLKFPIGDLIMLETGVFRSKAALACITLTQNTYENCK